MIKYYLNKIKSLCDEEDLADLTSALASLIASTPLSDQEQDEIFESLFPEDKPWSTYSKTSFIIHHIGKLEKEHQDSIKSIFDWTDIELNTGSEDDSDWNPPNEQQTPQDNQ